jgi:acetyl esterase/lipase
MHRAVGARRALRGPLRPSWSHPFETFAAFLRNYARFSVVMPVGLQRKLASRVLATSEIVRTTEIERVDAGGVPGAWFRRADSDSDRVLYYLHGGGYVIGSVDTHRELLALLCAAFGAPVFALEYRLAPEHPFPAQLEDSTTGYRWLLDQGVAPSRVAVAGESAGGALTISTLVSLRDRGEPLPAAAAVISPWVDLEARSASFRSNNRFDYLDRGSVRAFARHFVPDPSRRRDPLAAPIHASLEGLPPLLVHVGGAEVLLDEGLQLARNARLAGVDTQLDVWQDMIHAWHVFGGQVPEACEAIDQVGQFARRHTRAAADVRSIEVV